MRTLPIRAQIYLVAVLLLGIGAATCGMLTLRDPLRSHLWETLLFVAIAAVAYGKKIVLVRTKAYGEGSMTLGFAITFAAMLQLGPDGALIVGTVGCLSTCVYPKRQPLHQLFFNLAVAALSSWICGLVFWGLNGHGLALDGRTTFPAVAAAALLYYLTNTVLVAGIISLCSDRAIVPLWRETFLWTAPSYFAGACVGSIAVVLCHSNAWQTLLFVAPIAYLIYQSYSVYVSRASEKQASVEQLAHLYLSTIKSLALAIDAKDQYTHQHILRVQRYAVAIAKHMGLTGNELEAVNTGALLHDIGKLGVPEYVLLKPSRLTDEEFAKVKMHPTIGAAILDPVEFPWPVLPVVKYHHEKWDGTGYPEGLRGEAIPLTARILAAADVYDALTSSRSYRNAWTHEKAVDEIKRCAGTHFDPKVVEAFTAVIDGVVAEMQVEAKQAHEEALSQSTPPSKADEAARDIQRASSELWALYEVAETLSASLGIQESLDILGRKLAAILPGTTCLFLLVDENGGNGLIVRSATGPLREMFAGARSLNQYSRSARAFAEGAYRGPFDHDDLMMVGLQDGSYAQVASSMIVPVVYEDVSLGTINLYHVQSEAFTAHDQQLLEMIAKRASAAIYNGVQFELTKAGANTDPLTGLYTMRYLTQYVDESCVLAAERGEKVAVLCLDLDSFRSINDNFGHQRGDTVLRDLAGIFREVAGAGAVIARSGGDEFVVVAHGPIVEAQLLAERLQEAVETYETGLIHERIGAIGLGLSVGVGCFPDDGADFTALISTADARMYRDKNERKLGALATYRHASRVTLPKAA